MKTKKGVGNVIFNGLLVLLFIYFLWQGSQYNRFARMIPMFVSIPVLALCVIQFIIDLRKFLTGGGDEKPESEKKESESEKKKDEPRITVWRELASIAWVVGFALLIWLTGYLVALPLYTLLFCKFIGKESWPFSAGMGAFVFCLVYGVFITGVRLVLYPGIIYLTYFR